MNTVLNTVSTKGIWNTDNTHSNLNFTVDHLVISQVTGSFSSYSGSIVNESDDLTNAHIEFAIDVDSLDTNNEMRDNHLKSDDFFNAASYPQITFKSEKIVATDDNEFDIIGKMQIRDIEREVVFKGVLGGVAVDG